MIKYDVEFKIADAESTIAGEDRHIDFSIWDKEYSKEAVDEVCGKSDYKRKSDIEKLEYMQSSMPITVADITAITDDIINYYLTYFELNPDDDEVYIKVRFFMNGRTRKECGDAWENEIRISCMNLADNVARQFMYGKSLEDKLRRSALLCEYSDDESFEAHKADYFLLQLRYILAHEMYHVFHSKHYNHVNGKGAWTCIKEIDYILVESLADYFAYSYMRYYLENQYSGQENQINVRWNSVTSGGMKFFGIGRKKLISSKYSNEELERDNETWVRLREKEESRDYLELDDRNVCLADYAGGYVLWFNSYKNCKSVQGKALDEYVRIYNAMLEKKSEKALYELISMRENNV